jgi:hypothetical protein
MSVTYKSELEVLTALKDGKLGPEDAMGFLAQLKAAAGKFDVRLSDKGYITVSTGNGRSIVGGWLDQWDAILANQDKLKAFLGANRTKAEQLGSARRDELRAERAAAKSGKPAKQAAPSNSAAEQGNPAMLSVLDEVVFGPFDNAIAAGRFDRAFGIGGHIVESNNATSTYWASLAVKAVNPKDDAGVKKAILELNTPAA